MSGEKRKRNSTSDAQPAAASSSSHGHSHSPSISIPASKRQKNGNGKMSIKIPGLKARNGGAAGGVSKEDRARVSRSGTQMWMAVRAARSKTGLEVAHDFLKLPPKRQYPDYYQVIKRPIALDDIKGRLDEELYPTLQAVKDDFDLCFNNALTYNMERSPIWEAAKIMQRIALKEFKQLSQQDEADADVDVDGVGPSGLEDAEEEEDDDEEEEEDGNDEEYDASTKKSRPTYGELSNLLNVRLQKLITKAPKDPGGGLISDPFLVLPNKKEWPQYYQLIKKPIAFDTIERKLKRRSYHSSSEFAADVEQLFDNAMTFNEDNSPIWLAAQTLRSNFYKLMSDLPGPHAWTPPKPVQAVGKIKLKVGQPKAAPAPAAAKPAPAPKVPPPAAPAPVPPPAISTKPTFRAQPQQNQPPPPPQQQQQQQHQLRHKAPPVPQSATPTPPARPTSAAPPHAVPPPTRPAYQPQPSAQYHPNPHYQQQHQQQQTPARNAQTPNHPHAQHPPAHQHPQSNVTYQPQPLTPYTPNSGPSAHTPIFPPRSPSPEVPPTTTIARVGVTILPSGRVVQLFGTPYGDEEMVQVRCFALRLGWGEKGVRIEVLGEKPEDQDEPDGAEVTDDVKEKDELKAEVKWNGTVVEAVPRPKPAKDERDGEVGKKEEGDGTHGMMNGDVLLNGHADGKDESGSDSEHEHEHDDHPPAAAADGESASTQEQPALRATRSGRILSTPSRNGKSRRRKRKGPKSRVQLELGEWDVGQLNMGSNVVDVKVGLGAATGEGWRIFVDRSF